MFNIPNSTQIPNKIINGWLPKLTESELKVLIIVARQTLGWIEDKETGMRKREDWMTQKQLMKKTGLSQWGVTAAIKGLVKKDLIEVRDKEKIILETAEKRRQAGRKHKKIFYRLKVSYQGKQGRLPRKTRKNATKKSLDNKTNSLNKTNLLQKNNTHEQKDVRVRAYKRLPKEKQTIVHRLCYHLEDMLDTKIVNWGKQGAAIKRMMRAGYTEAEIKRTITYMARGDDFFADKGFDLVTASNAIPRYKGKASAIKRNHV